MTTMAAEIMTNAGIMLLDEQHIRWTLPELARWINEAVKTICLAKPSAATRSIILPLQQGTLQKLPLTTLDNGDQPLSLQKIVRNVKDPKQPQDGGRIITVVSGTTLDAQDPYWSDPKYVRFRREVRHYIYDEANPLEFMVYPGNDGTGYIQAVIACCPAPITSDSDENNIESWREPVGLPDPYSTLISEYLMYRALLKDDITGNAGRASFHFQQFQALLGVKIDIEGATSPNAGRLAQQ